MSGRASVLCAANSAEFYWPWFIEVNLKSFLYRYVRAMEMLLALQERTIVAKHQCGDLYNDLQKWIQLFTIFSSCRQDEVTQKFSEKEILIEQVRYAQEEMEV